jgi:SAM-dependent methyltransferase
MSLIQSMRQRDCPVCGEAAAKASLFVKRSLDEARLTKDSFASRKIPEFMSWQLVRCGRCATVFASEAPAAKAIANAYHEADYGSAEEAGYAASVYRQNLEPFLGGLKRRGLALEIGTGTGAFLTQLRQLGFRETVGIEPSPAAIAAAAPDMKSCIREGVFTGEEFAPGSASLICCFQTMEHVPDPRFVVEAAFRMLEPGGMLALITHDYTALINRVLGRRSPIIDIEHLQLFCPASLRFLMNATGYVQPAMTSIRNVYPLRYWLSLLPIPMPVKRAVVGTTQALRLDRMPVGFNVGNLLTVAWKPAAKSNTLPDSSGSSLQTHR